MGQTALVESDIDDGRKLIERLTEAGVVVTAAGWLKDGESGLWYLYLATPLVEEGGATRKAYRRVHEVMRDIPQPFWLDPLSVKVIAPDSPVAQAVQELHRRYPGGRPIRVGETVLGGRSVEGAYVYPPLHAPV
jgi:hypothetical protein